MNRIEIHSHTHYSNLRLLDCINKPIDLIKRAREIGLKGIAITDHECLSSHIEVNQYQKEIDDDFKIILGNEIYLCDTRDSNQKYYHFILLAKNVEGHKVLRELSSLAWMNNYSDRGMERVVTLKSDLEKYMKQHPGCLVASTACLGGELSSKTLEMENARKVGDVQTAVKLKNEIIQFVLWCKSIFGEDFYFEVAPAINREQIIVNKKIAEMALAFDVKMVIGTDAHYLTKEDRYVHKAFLNSKGGEREVDDFYEFSYLQTEEEIIKNLTPSIVDLYEEMCNNSMEIYDKIETYSLLHSQQIPKVGVKDYPRDNSKLDHPILESMLQSDNKIERYWINECLIKLKELDKFNDKYLDRLEEEADIKRTIGKALDTNMFQYPITLQHYVNLFWECGSTVGAGRGSSCSGLNHYLLGVTQLDPLEWDLPFWRYLNKERTELGDIDIDIAPSKRPVILNRIRKERGKNFLPCVDQLSRINLGCTLVATFGTETSKSAVLTACRGYRSEDYSDGIDNDTAQYLSSLIPSERGFIWSLSDVVYGNKDKDRKPIQTFANEVSLYPGLLEIMLGIEGLISRRGSHASGVIFFDEDPYTFGCFMKTPSGDIITQYDLHMAEAAGMTKYDFLVTSVQDKIVQAIDFLQADNQIEPELTLKEVYDKYFHPSVLPIDDVKTWQKIQNVEVLDLFQFDSDVGSQAAKKIKPSSVIELADANGLLRLMTAEKGAETPMDKYVRFKNNIQLWYNEMSNYGLTQEEQEALKPHFLRSHGVPPSQEQMMTMLMDPNICNFSLKDANTARKIVGKKQMNKIPALHDQVMAQAKRPELGKYVWECGIGPQMGYSFSVIHALAYSFIGYQTAYIATRWNPIYWDTACLVVNSGSLEDNSEEEIVSLYAPEAEDLANGVTFTDLPDRKTKIRKTPSANYGKIAKAIGDINAKGIEVSLININESDYGFKPDAKHNRILYGMKALSGINADMIEQIINGRPYNGIKDFMVRCPLNKRAMISLIKAGAFDEIDEDFNNRFEIMCYYISSVSGCKERLTLQNFNGLITENLIPKELELQVRVFNFSKYIKANCKVGEYFLFNNDCIEFFNRFLSEYSELLIVKDSKVFIEQKVWDKLYKSLMEPAKDYLKEHQKEMLNDYNYILFKNTWDKYATGNASAWEMAALCFYHSDHELLGINKNKYGIVNFDTLSREPVVDYFFKRAGRQIPIYKLYRIVGTVIDKNDTKSTVTLLTTTGVVTVKFTRDYYAMFKKQISQVNPDGSKTVIEKGWFSRGVKLMVQGYRREDMFVAKNYKNSQGHQLYKINEVAGNDIILQHDRFSGNGVVEEEYDD